MAKNIDTDKVGTLIHRMASQYGWDDRLLLEEARALLLASIEPAIRAHIRSVRISDQKTDYGTCYLQTDNAAARTNLSFALFTLKEKVNGTLGKEVIRSIRLV